MISNTNGNLRLNKVAEELEQLILLTLMSSKGSVAVSEFIEGLKSLTFDSSTGRSTPVLANDILDMKLFGDEQLSKLVSDVKKCIDMNKPYSTELKELVSYLKMITSNRRGSKLPLSNVPKKTTFSNNTYNSREVTFNMITDREIDAIEQSNIDRINEKVISMKGSMDALDAKLDQLVKQQSEILGVPPVPTTPEEKIEALNHSVNCIASAMDNLCGYINYSDNYEAGFESAIEDRDTGKSMGIATEAAARNGLNPGDPGYDAFIDGYKEGETEAGDGAEMAQLHSLGMDGITYSDAHDAYFSEDGDMYVYSDEFDAYIEPRTGEVLQYSATDGVFFSEDMGLNDVYEGELYTADGDMVGLYSDSEGDLVDEFGNEVVYSEDADAFFSADGTMLFSEEDIEEFDDEFSDYEDYEDDFSEYDDYDEDFSEDFDDEFDDEFSDYDDYEDYFSEDFDDEFDDEFSDYDDDLDCFSEYDDYDEDYFSDDDEFDDEFSDYDDYEDDYFSEDFDDEFDDEFSEYDDYDEYDYSDDDVEVVDVDEDGNAVCYSAEDDEFYYYSAEDDEAFSETELNCFSEDFDDEFDDEFSDYDDDDYYYSDDEDDDDEDVVEEEVEVRDGDTGELIDSTKVVQVNEDNGDAILHSDYTGEDYLYSAEDDSIYSETELAQFSEMEYDDGNLGETTNYSIYNKVDNRSDAAITTFSFLEDNGGLLNEDNAVDRYYALQDYLSHDELEQ